MGEMIVKDVDVMGDLITAAKDPDGNIWVGVRWVCDALDMTEGQMKRQIKNIKKDMLFSRGGSNQIPLPTGNNTQEVFCIRNDFVPLWLAKITITEKTREERPEFADKLLDYQLKAKDILAAAFMPNKEMPQTVQGQIQLLAQGNVELNQRVDGLEEETHSNKEEIRSVKEDLAKFKADIPAFNADTKEIQDALRKKAINALGGKDSNAYHDNSVRGYAFADIQIELRRQFGVKRYDQIKHSEVAIALKIIKEYKPPMHIKDKIDMANAQQTLKI